MEEQTQEACGQLACILEPWTRNAHFYPLHDTERLIRHHRKLSRQATGSLVFQIIFPIITASLQDMDD